MLSINESLFDRMIRVILGLGLVSLVFFGPHTAWGWIGLLPIATGVFGFCPLYRLVGISTCSLRDAPGHG